jgi:undecaprenyl-diphosphatase
VSRPYVRRRLDVWIALVAIGVVVASAAVAASGDVGGPERAVFRAINDLPDQLERPMWALQLFGLLLFPAVVALGALIARKWRLALGLVLVIPAKLLLEKQVVKAIVERERPGTTVPGAILRDAHRSGLSFPSGHAIIAFAVATLVAPYLSRRWKIGLFVVAVLAGLARIYLGAHNPLDIVAGAGIGVAIGCVLNLSLGVPGRRALFR